MLELKNCLLFQYWGESFHIVWVRCFSNQVSCWDLSSGINLFKYVRVLSRNNIFLHHSFCMVDYSTWVFVSSFSRSTTTSFSHFMISMLRSGLIFMLLGLRENELALFAGLWWNRLTSNRLVMDQLVYFFSYSKIQEVFCSESKQLRPDHILFA